MASMRFLFLSLSDSTTRWLYLSFLCFSFRSSLICVNRLHFEGLLLFLRVVDHVFQVEHLVGERRLGFRLAQSDSLGSRCRRWRFRGLFELDRRLRASRLSHHL